MYHNCCCRSCFAPRPRTRSHGGKEEKKGATRAENETKLEELQDFVAMLDACVSEMSAESRDALPM